MIGLTEPFSPGAWARALVVAAGVVLILVAARRVIDVGHDPARPLSFQQHLLMLGLTLVALLAVVLALPFDHDTRGQILGFLGILLSAAVALSSTNLLGNAMAGLSLRAVKNFRVGDFVQIEEHFGRVTEMGLLHTEIQTEDRDLLTLPNSFLASRPVKRLRRSGTILSATVGLGYDASRGRVEELLLAAAAKLGLEEPFVSVLELGDFSVTYRVAGLLRDVTHVVSSRSRLRVAVMDELHTGGIEIVSPVFLNSRQLTRGTAVLPEPEVAAPARTTPEALIFDKAEEAAALHRLRSIRDALAARLGELEGGAAPTEGERDLAALQKRLKRLDASIAQLEERSAEDD